MSYDCKPSSLKGMTSLGLPIDPDTCPYPVFEEIDVFDSVEDDRSCCDDFCAEFIEEELQANSDDNPLDKFILITTYGMFLIRTAGYNYIRYACRLA